MLSGRVFFASVIVLAGIMGIIDGIVTIAIASTEWGIVHVVVGTIVVAAGFAVLVESANARTSK